jgi:hypothetical protein
MSQVFIPIIESKKLDSFDKVEDAIEFILTYFIKNEVIDFQNYYEDILPSGFDDKIYCRECYSFECEDEDGNIIKNCKCRDCKKARTLQTCENCKKQKEIDDFIFENKNVGKSFDSNKFVKYIMKQYDWNDTSQINNNLEKLFKEFSYQDKALAQIEIK